MWRSEGYEEGEGEGEGRGRGRKGVPGIRLDDMEIDNTYSGAKFMRKRDNKADSIYNLWYPLRRNSTILFLTKNQIELRNFVFIAI